MVFRRVREIQGVSAQEIIEPGIVVVHRVRLVHDERRRLDEGTTISKCVHHTFERLGQIWDVLERRPRHTQRRSSPDPVESTSRGSACSPEDRIFRPESA